MINKITSAVKKQKIRNFTQAGQIVIWEAKLEKEKYQEKLIKYNNLVANALIYQNIIDQTRIIQSLIREGYTVTPEILKTLSPYLTKHIKRFGNYVVNLTETPPLDIEYTFSLDK